MISKYEEQLGKYRSALYDLRQKHKLFGWLRLGSILIPFLLAYAFLPSQLPFFIIGFVIMIAIFLFLVSKDADNDEKIKYFETLIFINEEEIRILTDRFTHREDGKKWEPENHAYASDLDIFGKYSIYQYLNRSESEQGKGLLAKQLLIPLPFESISKYQEAVKELKPLLEWRQDFQCFGKLAGFSFNTEKRITNWINSDKKDIPEKFWKIPIVFYPIIPITTVVLYATGIIPLFLFLLFIYAFFSFSGMYTKMVNETHNNVSKITKEIDGLQQQMLLFENEKFLSGLLNTMQKNMQGKTGKASTEFKSLKTILNRFDLRLNMVVSPILNIFILWDIRQMLALQSWKHRNRELVKKWIDTIAQLECLNSTAIFSFNHPNFIFPVVTANYFDFETQNLGHPLIDAGKRVSNDCRITGIGQIMLVTGSNMAGKSTFLRSVGVNAVLAYMGAPVCADSMKISYAPIVSSMRIADNLAENTSTFYAELKKLKNIIDKVNSGEKIFILLDEILRGTNSLDRHSGSVAFIRQLIQENAVAIVATHDVELAAMQNDFPGAIHNYHFDVQVSGEELYFDYKLKTGVCRSMNASILMKKIGIRI
ncbi:MAG: hypothetical protein C5B52_02805 [Bacteroidetes bacterium]|nr:MAG: hypothetical protein C5B52_02805 [Bacteroidota bacterium]